MRDELVEANRRIATLLGVTPRTSAYRCAQKVAGRRPGHAELRAGRGRPFATGRRGRGESSNDPAFIDLAQTLGVEMDERDFVGIRPLLDEARTRGAWLVLAGHDIGAGNRVP